MSDFGNNPCSNVGNISPVLGTEAGLSAEIRRLWGAHQKSRVSISRGREELNVLRRQLAEKLHRMKAVLVGTGRAGGWAAFLRINSLPRATADRLVARHEASLYPAENRLTEPFLEPTEEEIRGLVRRLIPKLHRYLVDGGAVDRLFAELNLQIPRDGFGQPEVTFAP